MDAGTRKAKRGLQKAKTKERWEEISYLAVVDPSSANIVTCQLIAHMMSPMLTSFQISYRAELWIVKFMGNSSQPASPFISFIPSKITSMDEHSRSTDLTILPTCRRSYFLRLSEFKGERGCQGRCTKNDVQEREAVRQRVTVSTRLKSPPWTKFKCAVKLR